MCILFQNDIRLRSGKLSQPTETDVGVLWMLQTYFTNMQQDGKTVHVVPVSINYERVFEVRNIAIEMVSGKVPRLSFLQLMNMLQVETKGKLGRCFVNYGRVINLREYLKNISLPQITHENLEDASLRVSEKLYKEQQHMTAANLSQVVSCILLLE
jgi:glycerol-3-phosphate O-acyltransferase